MSSQTNKTNFLSLNKDRAKDFNPYKKPMICDSLDERSKSRLVQLTEDIDEDLDKFIKQKDEYYKITLDEQMSLGGVRGNPVDPDNAYLYSQ
jgi:hypothetical protein